MSKEGSLTLRVFSGQGSNHSGGGEGRGGLNGALNKGNGGEGRP
jgi:hypothetical protein